MARQTSINTLKAANYNMNRFVNEDELKAETMSIQIRSPKVDTSIRDKSCIIVFPRNLSESKLTRISIEKIMRDQWGELFDNITTFGNIDFSRKWIFSFDTVENNEKAVAKVIFVNNLRINAYHATKKFNIIKID